MTKLQKILIRSHELNIHIQKNNNLLLDIYLYNSKGKTRHYKKKIMENLKLIHNDFYEYKEYIKDLIKNEM